MLREASLKKIRLGLTPIIWKFLKFRNRWKILTPFLGWNQTFLNQVHFYSIYPLGRTSKRHNIIHLWQRKMKPLQKFFSMKICLLQGKYAFFMNKRRWKFFVGSILDHHQKPKVTTVPMIFLKEVSSIELLQVWSSFTSEWQFMKLKFSIFSEVVQVK